MTHHGNQDHQDAESGTPVVRDREQEQKADQDKQPQRPPMPKQGEPQHQGGQTQPSGSPR